MKRNFYFLFAVALAAFNGCAEEVDTLLLNEESEEVRLTVGLESVVKSSGTASENLVNTLQVLVFDAEGLLEATDRTSSSATLSITCKPGQKKVVAIVNDKEVSGISDYSGLTACRSYLENNTLSSFAMEGSLDVDVKSSETLTVPVRRIASKVTLSSVTLEFGVDSYKDEDVKLVSAYLVNVAADKKFLSSSAPSSWLNWRAKSDENEDFLFKKYDKQLNPEGEVYSPATVFYAYPNPTLNDTSEDSSVARFTRMVVEMSIGGEIFYYPVNLPQLSQNTAYNVNLTVTRPGSDTPDDPVELETAEYTIDVVEWTETDPYNEVI